ncbi:MAG: type II 3-dehydroquinate dehydratase [Gammaproteobacteria bacterium]|nr:type II 3-dehydroquinate dehydratase [Gammaproteobacteria bacterium]
MAKILLLHGPNLNLLGQREPGHYGSTGLETINKRLTDLAQQANVVLSAFQSNSEEKLINRIHAAGKEKVDFILFNPAAYTHTSVALRDALLAIDVPFIEIHLSNVYKREAFRHHSYFSDIAVGVISGLGVIGYECALNAALEQLSKPKN